MVPLEKLALLERQLTQMIELIKRLQTEKKTLREQVNNLSEQNRQLTRDLEQGHQQIDSLAQLTEENQRFQEERGQVYAKLETMLKGLEGLEI